MLLERPDLDVNVKDEEGRTVLIIAAFERNIKNVELLLERGVNINEKTRQGFSALTWAVIARSPEIVRLLLSQPNIIVDQRAISMARVYGMSQDIIKKMEEMRVRVEFLSWKTR